MENLTAPSKDSALQILDEVNFENRLMGSNLHVRTGMKIVSLYSLEELFMLLTEPHPLINVDRVENWIRTIIHDGELADRIKTVILQEAGDQDTLHSIRDLVGWRLMQCKHVTGSKDVLESAAHKIAGG